MRSFEEELVEGREAPLRRMRELRAMGGPRRGFSDEFHRLAVEVVRGKEHPVTTLAQMFDVDISTASRWLSKGRRL